MARWVLTTVTDGRSRSVVLDPCRDDRDGSVPDFIRPVKQKPKEIRPGDSKKPEIWTFPERNGPRHKPRPLFRLNNEAGANGGLRQISAALLLLFPHRVPNRNKTKDLHDAETLMWKICPEFRKQLRGVCCRDSFLHGSAVGRVCVPSSCSNLAQLKEAFGCVELTSVWDEAQTLSDSSTAWKKRRAGSPFPHLIEN